MSHFYGTLQGNRGEATRCGTSSSGVQSNVAGWGGTITVTTYFDPKNGMDMAKIWLNPWRDSGGTRLLIAIVELDAVDGMVYYPTTGGRRRALKR